MSQGGLLTNNTSAAADIETLSGDTGGAVGPDAAFNVTITGNPDIDVVGTPGTNSFQLTDLTKWTPYIVDAAAGAAPYTTIQAAITAAEVTGSDEVVLIRPGIYTENLTFSTGTVDLLGAVALGDESQVEIVGTHTPPASGHLVIRNIRVSSATDVFNSAVAGTGHLVIIDAVIAVTNGYAFNIVNWAPAGIIELFDINSSAGTNDGVLNNTGGCQSYFFESGLGAGSVNTMNVSGPFAYQNMDIACPISFQGTSSGTIDGSPLAGAISTSGTANITIRNSSLSTGASSCITHDSATTMILADVNLTSAAVNAIAGSGTINLSSVTYTNSSGISGTITGDYTGALETGSSYAQEISLDRGTNHLKTSATGQTIGAVTADLYTLNLGAIASAYNFTAQVVGFASATGLSVGYNLRQIVETNGAAATFTGDGAEDAGEEAAATAADAVFVVSGNNVIIRVTGIAGSTFNWRVVVEWTRVE